jgi:5,10-methylene-tetrahydrofolate dehydrogenase/methenyl tetrahydrofolate cyclohydrolase
MQKEEELLISQQFNELIEQALTSIFPSLPTFEKEKNVDFSENITEEDVKELIKKINEDKNLKQDKIVGESLDFSDLNEKK